MTQTQAEQDVGINGTFAISMNTQMGAQSATLEFTVNGSELAGKMNSIIGTIEFDGGTIDGPNLSWTMATPSPVLPKIDATATVRGDTITGEVIMGAMGKAPFEGTRVEEGATVGLGDTIDVRMVASQMAFGGGYQGPVGTVLLAGTTRLAPSELVATLLDPDAHGKLVGHPITVQKSVGTRVQLPPDVGDGYLAEFIEDSHVTFLLRAPGYPDNHYSTVTVMGKAQGGGANKVTVYQQSVPKELIPDVKAAWERGYLKPLESAG